MIDEAFDTELENRLRAALAEMIPKLLAPSVRVDERGSQAPVVVTVGRARATLAPRSRRTLVAVLAVAATLIGLFAIAARDNDGTTTGSPEADGTPPPWYDTIAPLLPERFPYVALTLVTDVQLWFVAINPTDGKTLEIQLASGGYSAEPTTTVDATGEWVETAQGWSVKTPSGLFVSVTCDIGVGGRDFAGPPNYCDMTSGVLPYTKTEIRALTNTLATSLSPSIFDQKLGRPQGDAINATSATSLIAAAIPDQQQISDTDWGQDDSDRVYDYAVDPSLPDTSVRILHGVYPTSLVNSEAAAALYETAAAVWMFGAGGTVVRISTTDPSPDSVTRLQQLARDLMALDPVASKPDSTATFDIASTTSTSTTNPITGLGAETSTTVSSCGPSASLPTVLVVNASNLGGTATWWRDELAANVPGVEFAEPAIALAKAPTSRVLALAGYECMAGLVAAFTTASTVETATIESLQSLVAEPLPAGTSIMVLVGNDNMANFTTGVTTTINN